MTLDIFNILKCGRDSVTCLSKELSFACCTLMYLFQGRAASFILPGKIKLYYSLNMTRGWQTLVSPHNGTQRSGTWSMYLPPPREERIDWRAVRCIRRRRKRGLISTLWCETQTSPSWSKSQCRVLGLSDVTAQAEQRTPRHRTGQKTSRGIALGFLIFVLLSASDLAINKCNFAQAEQNNPCYFPGRSKNSSFFGDQLSKWTEFHFLVLLPVLWQICIDILCFWYKSGTDHLWTSFSCLQNMISSYRTGVLWQFMCWRLWDAHTGGLDK